MFYYERNLNYKTNIFLAAPESCLALSTCSGIATDGEYWVYPISMVVNGTDYTFTSLTGSKPIQYGYARDCNGEHFRNPCPHFGTATIDTRGTGLIVDPTVEFGAFPSPESFEGSTEDFNRSALGDQISFTCAGWCGSCGPISGPIRFQHSTEFISAADAQAIICHK
uniref:Uncharacterized protein n=1 Tax=Magallana gigas TaxID=29159 RepID=K1QDX1_MAGGI